MILFPLLALLIGFALFYGLGRGFQADEAFARYTAIAVLAGLDTVLGGLRAHWSNSDDFDDVIFVSGFFVNALLAGALVMLGEKLGLQAGLGQGQVSAMMLAAAVVFGTRIFNNLAALRRLLIEKWRGPGRSAAPSAGKSRATAIHANETRPGEECLSELPPGTASVEPAAHPAVHEPENESDTPFKRVAARG